MLLEFEKKFRILREIRLYGIISVAQEPSPAKTNMKSRVAILGLFGVLLGIVGCTFPAISVPKKLPGSQAVGKTVDHLFGSTITPKTEKAFDEDFDYTQLTEKKQKKPNVNAKTPDKPASPGKSIAAPPIQEKAAQASSSEATNPMNPLSQDSWVANAELRTWLEKQAEAGEIPSVHSLTASPSDPNRKAKTNIYDELNATAGSKIQRGNFTTRDSADAKRGPISLYRWYHGSIEETTNKLLDPKQTTPDQLNAAKYQTARLLAESPPKSVLAANSAILLARLGIEEVKPFLLEAVKNGNFSPTLRCAAAEAFAGCKETKDDELTHLYSLYAESDTESGSNEKENGKTQSDFHPGVPDLAVELLQSLAQRKTPTEDPAFTTALKSRIPAVRLAATKIWRDHPPTRDSNGVVRGTCPDELLALISDPTDPRIRIAAMNAAARWNHPRTMQRLQDGIEDTQLTVRLAAAGAMGIVGAPDAVHELKEHVNAQSPKMRAQVAASLRKLGDKDALFRLADDKASEVRIEVAKALDDPRANRTVELAKKMLADPSAQVQKCTIEAIGCWPLEHSAPVLFGEMESNSLLKRETAMRMLGNLWQPALTFDYENRSNEARAESLASLKDRFESEDKIASLSEESEEIDERSSETTGPIRQASWRNPRELDRLSLDKGCKAIALYTDPEATREERDRAREQMIAMKDKFPLVVEYLHFTEKRAVPEEIYTDILPLADEIFEALESLEQGTVSQRRRAADEILGKARLHPLGPLVVSRLCDIGVMEDDTLTGISLFQIFELSPGDLADRFAIESLDSDAPEIRRRACALLGQSEELAVLRNLLPMLNDTSVEVVRTTLASLGSLAPLYFDDADEEEIDPSDTRLITDPIRVILMRSETTLQIAAAVALVQWNDPAGAEAIRRLSFSPDDKTRLALAQAIGRLHDPRLADVPIRLLDDKRGSVRQAALDSLPKLVGTDHGNVKGKTSIPLPDRIEAWKSWGAKR